MYCRTNNIYDFIIVINCMFFFYIDLLICSIFSGLFRVIGMEILVRFFLMFLYRMFYKLMFSEFGLGIGSLDRRFVLNDIDSWFFDIGREKLKI